MLLPVCDAGGRSAVLQLMEKMYTLNVYTFSLPFLPVVVEHTAIDSAPTAAASGGAREC